MEAANHTSNLLGKSFRSDPEFLQLAQSIKSGSRGGAFHYYASPGNWGDALLNEGALEFFASQEFHYSTRHRSELPNVKERSVSLAVVGGGGGWCENWSSTPKFVARAARVYTTLVILPTTFDPEVAPLNLSNVVYFSRDKNPAATRAIYCPDMAFFRAFAALPSDLAYPLICLRRDKERHPLAPSPDRNLDVSLLGNGYHDAHHLVRLVARFPVIYTDRLHIAISGAMLGREVHLLEGNYPKNRRVFEATMEGRLPNVSMMSWEEFSEASIPGKLPL